MQSIWTSSACVWVEECKLNDIEEISLKCWSVGVNVFLTLIDLDDQEADDDQSMSKMCAHTKTDLIKPVLPVFSEWVAGMKAGVRTSTQIYDTQMVMS